MSAVRSLSRPLLPLLMPGALVMLPLAFSGAAWAQSPDEGSPDDAASGDAASGDAASNDAASNDAASDEASPDETSAAEPAPDEGDDLPSDELGGLAPSASARQIVAGDVIDGWAIASVDSPARLPDGRPTEEPCGWVRDVTVLKRGDDRPTPRSALLQVPCLRRSGRVVPGKVRVVVKASSPAPLTAGPAALTPPPGLPPPTATKPSTTASAQTGGEPTTAPAAPAAAKKPPPPPSDTPFLPEDLATVAVPPVLKDGAKAYAGPKKDDESLTGVVLLELSIDRNGRVRRARRVGASAGAELDKLAVQKAEAFVFEPAKKNVAAAAKPGAKPDEAPAEPELVAVDTVMPFEIKFTDGPPPKEGVVLNYDTDWFTIDGPAEKSELSRLGSVRLLNPLNSAGVGFGVGYIDQKIFGVITPNLDLHYGKLSVGFGFPIRFQLYDAAIPIETLQGNAALIAESETFTAGFAGAGTLRFADWDHLLQYPFSDWLVPLRYLTWGKKEEYIYADFNRVNPITIGHGQLIRRYMPNVDIDQNNSFAEVDAYYHFGGVEAMVGPLPIPRLVGGLAFIKPLGLFLDDTFSRSWSVGVSYVADLNAPTQLTTTYDDKLERYQYALDVPLYGDFLGSDGFEFVHANKDQPLGWVVQGVGVDSEIKVVKWKFLDIKVYGDYSHLIFPGVPEDDIAPFMGGGATAGALFRLSFGSKPVNDYDDELAEVKQGLKPQPRKAVHALRLRTELKVFSPQYLPSYFNPLYEHDKHQFGFATTPQDQRATLPTKLAYLAEQSGDPFRLGWYLEGSYTLTDWFAVTAVYEDAIKLWGELATVPSARSVMLHAETQGLGFFQLFATYHYRNFEFRDWLRLLNVGSENELIFMGGRLSVLFLSLNFGLQRGLRLDRLQSDLPSVREVGGVERPHSSVGLQNQWSFAGNVELGWSW